jgi:plasmid stability protein
MRSSAVSQGDVWHVGVGVALRDRRHVGFSGFAPAFVDGARLPAVTAGASIACMATLTIRQLDEKTKKRLRMRAANHGRSMEEEAREILKSAVAARPARALNLVESIRRRLEPLGFVDLPEVPREPLREPPPFDK